jgi:hypothetical protein
VVTAPVARTIFRIVELPVSATKRLPAPSSATPRGWSNSAAAPVPSALPGVSGEPASVVTIPVAMAIFRIVLLPESATKRLPAPSLVRPAGA